MNTYRIENDLIGDIEVPTTSYYGAQTQRAVNNFKISNHYLSDYPIFIKALAQIKLAAAQANHELNLLPKEVYEPIRQACEIIISGKHHKEFPINLIQGGAGTSTNMNINEVIANVALEIMGHKKGTYEHCSPNDHVNLSQSTNDVYPTALKITLFETNKSLLDILQVLMEAFREKSSDFEHILKLGRTQLQDAVPMTLGQEFEVFACTLEKSIRDLKESSQQFLEINMGATAIGTGLNCDPKYAELCKKYLATILEEPIKLAPNLMEATADTSSFVIYSDALKRTALKISKICNDLRLLSSGPRGGLNEINLPAVQPGSSIMPGKVNPVIPEVVNQVCFKVIGNNLTVSLAAEAGQLQLNVMEPIMAQSILESIDFLKNALKTLTEKCVNGITANEAICKETVLNSIGIITALNPYIGYKNSNKIAMEALESGRGIDELVIEHKLLTEEQLSRILDPETMLSSGKRIKI